MQAASDNSVIDSTWNTRSAGAFGANRRSEDQTLLGSSLTAGGSLLVLAGKDITLSASQLASEGGTATLGAGGNLTLTSRSATEQKFKQSGLTLAITSPVLSAIQTVQQMGQAAGNTSSTRMKGLAAANSALAVNNAANATKAGQGSSGNNPSAATEPGAADKAGGINLSLSIGGSKSQSNTASQSSSARGSSVAAAGDVRINATGAGQDSKLTVQGSRISAGGDATLMADNDIKLLAASNEASQKSTNKSSSGSVGVSVGSSGFGVTASASAARGKSDGQDTTYSNTRIEAGNTLRLQSGGDTTLKGAVVAGRAVQADIGGNLSIESLQDSSQYASKQQSLGASVTVGAGFSGSISASKSNANGNFASVTEQSGLKAGDGGFTVNVKGNTDLKGAVIESSTKAVQDNKNTFTTGTLTFSDLQNKADYQASSFSLSAGAGQQGSTASLSGVGAGIGSDKGSASSTTSSGISGIAGNTAVRSTDAPTGIGKIFDAEKVQKEIDAQTQITQAFSKEAPKAVASYAATQAAELKNAGNFEEAKKWDEGGVYRIALHTASGALGGGLSGAAGAVASASAAPLMNQLQDGIANTLQTAGLSAGAAKGIAQGVTALTAAGVGAAVGGAQGAATAMTVDANNRQLHPTEIKRIKELAGKDPQKEARLTAAACAMARCYAEYPEGSAAYNELKMLANAGASVGFSSERQLLQNQAGLFTYTTVGLINDQTFDAARQLNNTYQIDTRVLGAGQAVLGAAAVAGGVVTAPASCATGVGCVVTSVVVASGMDAAYTGSKQAVSGQSESSLTSQALQGLGMSPEAATYAEFALGVGAAAKAGAVVNAASASQVNLNAAARLSQEPIQKFGAQGVKVTPEVMSTPQAQAIVREYMAAGVPEKYARDFTADLIQTGKNLPTPTTVGHGVELIKVVPKTTAGGDAVSSYTPFFVTRQEFDNLSRLPTDQIAQRLGLPAEQGVRGAQLGFDAYIMTPKPGTTPNVFVSEVAPIQQGNYAATGGAQQVLVPNRAVWSDPLKIGAILGSK